MKLKESNWVFWVTSAAQSSFICVYR